MKKTLPALLLLLALLTLVSCANKGNASNNIENENEDALTVKLVKQVIYRDSVGELYYVDVNNNDYSHGIGTSKTLHSFTKKAPDKIQGFTVSVERTLINTSEEETPTTNETPVQEDPFPYQTVAYGTSSPAKKPLRIYDKQTIYNRLKSQASFSSSYWWGSIPSNSENDTDWSEYQKSFAKNNALDFSFTYNDYEYRIVIKLETFTYRESVEKIYTFAEEYSITKTPYYDSETGELTAHYVTITTIGDSGHTSTLSFYEYE